MAAISPRSRRRRIQWSDLDPIGVGVELKKAREMLGLPIEDVSEETRIRLSHLRALEDEDFSRLPTGVAGRGLLRAYATYLGLDAVELLAALEAHGRLPVAAEAIERVPRRPARARHSYRRLAGVVASVVCVFALAYYLYSEYATFVSAEASGVPRATISARGASPTMTPQASTPTALPAQVAVKQAAAVPVTPVASPTPAPPTATSVPVRPVRTGPPLLVPAPTPVPPTPTPVELVVEATILTSTHVTAQVDGQTVSDEDISAGDQRTWRGSTITLQVSNAGAVEVAVNGRPAVKLGANGQSKTVTWAR